MQQNAGLFSQHVSSIIMTILRSILVSTAFSCPTSILLHLVGYLFHIIYDARSHEHQICIIRVS
jgi:hypothetical protein